MKVKPVSARKLIRVLERHGFERVSQKGSHVKLRNGCGKIVIVPDHRGKKLRVGLVRAILAQAGLSPRNLAKK